MSAKIFIAACVVFLSNCMSLKDAGRAYFNPRKNYVGVQNPQEVIQRIENNKKIRHIIYGSLKEDKIIECIFLRNQIYVASLMSLSKEDKRELKRVSEIMEQAYQFDDQDFLQACDQVKNSHVGRLFGEIQNNYFERS